MAILELLVERQNNLAQKIDAAAEKLLHEVDVEGLAADVKDATDFLKVEDVWDRSGASRHGYFLSICSPLAPCTIVNTESCLPLRSI